MLSSLSQLWRSRNKMASLRVLLIADSLGATQHISFATPLARRIAAGTCRLEMRDAAWLAKASKSDIGALWRRLDPTLVIFSRYSGAHLQPIVAQARTAGVAILSHLDDDLFAVPAALGEAKFKHYNDPTRLANLRAAVECSDLLYVSTAELGRRLSLYGLRPPIIAGEIYCSAELLPMPSQAPEREVIGYMGTGGHAQDLAMIVPAIAALLEKRPGLSFETFGTIKLPDDLTRFGRRVVHHKAIDNYQSFLEKLASLRWTLGLAPLEDTDFNRCKADTKWVEYTVAGVPAVASAGVVYRRANEAGAVSIAETDWTDAIEALLQSPQKRSDQLSTARQLITTSYSAEALEQQLLSIFAQVGAVSVAAQS